MADQAEIHRMARSWNVVDRIKATEQLSKNFADLPDRKQAWDDLHCLTFDNDIMVHTGAAYVVGGVFSHLPDKKQAWNDLVRLTSNTGRDVRRGVAFAIGSAFEHVPDKEQAWECLHRLTFDSDSAVREGATDAIGSAFAHVPNKKQAWEDLIRLTFDTISHVRMTANHSFGKVCINRAGVAECEDVFRKEMENALGFFEKASKEVSFFNPAKFCLPFYRTFYTLTFKKEEAEAEVQNYLSEARSAVAGSDSKEKLLEAVENLGNALKEAQKTCDFSDMKADLNAYRRYLDHACELLDTTEDKAPGASRLIRKGLPIIDERIKGIIAEIQEKARALCKQTRGTTFEDLGKNVYRIGQNLLVENPAILEKRLNDLQISLSAICARTSEINVGEACDLLKRANNEPILENRIQLMDEAISEILPYTGNMPKIQISNSNNVQVGIGTNIIQNQESNPSRKKVPEIVG